MPAPTTDPEALREIEGRRLKALVDRDMAVAASLHADDYELVTPGGMALSKQEYLTVVESGDLDYRTFEAATDIAVRMLGETAILRYRARITIGEDHAFDGLFWHTDYYEWRDDRWQAVWSQATRILDARA